MSELWTVITIHDGQRKLFWNDEHRWWCDYSGATLYGTKDMAEVAAFSIVSHDSSLVGCVEVEQVVGMAGRGS